MLIVSSIPIIDLSANPQDLSNLLISVVCLDQSNVSNTFYWMGVKIQEKHADGRSEEAVKKSLIY